MAADPLEALAVFYVSVACLAAFCSWGIVQNDPLLIAGHFLLWQAYFYCHLKRLSDSRNERGAG